MRARSTLDWSQSKIFLVRLYFYVVRAAEICETFPNYVSGFVKLTCTACSQAYLPDDSEPRAYCMRGTEIAKFPVCKLGT